MKRLNLSIFFIFIHSTLYPSIQYNYPLTDNDPLEYLLNTISPDELQSLLSLPIYNNLAEFNKPLSITHSQSTPTQNSTFTTITVATTIAIIISTSLLLSILSSHLNFPPPLIPPIPAPGQAF